ncbi:SPOSA6832_04838, partial [Sporobolomyces salmonicolor]
MSVSTMSTLSSSPALTPPKAAQAPVSALPAASSSAEKGQAQPFYAGEGTAEKPYIVKFEEGDPENPQNWSPAKKWAITANVAVSTLCVAFGSSIYAGGLGDLLVYFKTSQEVITLGLSLYVLGFALGPLLSVNDFHSSPDSNWAPFSEQWGRILIFRFTYFPFAAFHIGAACARNLETMLICRFLAGFFGASPLTNSGGTLLRFRPRPRDVALCARTFHGPGSRTHRRRLFRRERVMEASSTRWLFWLLTIFSFVMYALGLLTPETYAPVLLRRRAAKLQKENGQVYRSMYDLHPMFSAPFTEKMKTALHRPFVLLFKEMIVLLFSLYAAVIYGILYLMFGKSSFAAQASSNSHIPFFFFVFPFVLLLSSLPPFLLCSRFVC